MYEQITPWDLGVFTSHLRTRAGRALGTRNPGAPPCRGHSPTAAPLTGSIHTRGPLWLLWEQSSFIRFYSFSNCPFFFFFFALAPLSTLKGREQLGGTPSVMPQSRGSRSLTPNHAGCSLISRVNKPDTVIYWVCFSLHLWSRRKSRSHCS